MAEEAATLVSRAAFVEGKDMHGPQVLTLMGVNAWKGLDAQQYAESGSPAAGDAVTKDEVQALCKGLASHGPELLTTMGILALPGSKLIHRAFKLDCKADEWCEKSHEEPQAPLWPILDPHHHFYVAARQHGDSLENFLAVHFSERCMVLYGWYYGNLVAEAAGNNVVGSVYVECGQGYKSPSYEAFAADPTISVGEPRYVQEIAGTSKAPIGIISHLKLELGREAVEKGIQAHKQAAANLVGVRQGLCWSYTRCCYSEVFHAQPQEVSRTAAFREGMALLAEHDLTYDTWLFWHNLPELIDLARACPKNVIILDHVGTPTGNALCDEKLEDCLPEWRRSITELAGCPNVVVKLSGLSMCPVGFGFEWQDKPPTSQEMADAYEPLFRHVLEAFGASRCFFASNFPVDKASGSYTTHMNAFKILARRLLPGDEAAQRALFYDNAVRVYKLDRAPFGLPATSALAEEQQLPSY